MDIRDFWPLEVPAEHSPELWSTLIEFRRQTWTGFASIEAERGFVKPKVSPATSQGQEIIRILCFRVLEELAEAFTSEDRDHYMEELIDAFNYLLSIFLLSGKQSPDLPEYLYSVSAGALGSRRGKKIQQTDLGYVTVILGAELGDLLRNRAWMNNSQNTYFDGDLFKILEPIFILIWSFFDDYVSFWQYFVAKDSVLQFRLKSKY